MFNKKKNAGEDIMYRSRSPFANKPVAEMVVEKTQVFSATPRLHKAVMKTHADQTSPDLGYGPMHVIPMRL